MREYEKIETLFNRDVNGTKKLIFGSLRNEAIEYLMYLPWIFTEKIDGTNIRIHWDGHKVSFGARTEKSTIPPHLMKYLVDTFGGDETEQLFEQTYGDKEVILFGEGYGAKINKGEAYRPDVSFILFDVLVEDIYQSREVVEDTATMFGIEVVPVVCAGTIDDGVRFVMSNPKSTIGNAMMEGVVGRPLIELKDGNGQRVIVKMKWKDFKYFCDEL